MSLATRCFTCGTVFRVVQDQLKVSEGWVRCGQCNEVFNALETLFDLERDTPPEWSPPNMKADDMPSRLGSPVDLELPATGFGGMQPGGEHRQPEHDRRQQESNDDPSIASLLFEDPDHFDVPMMERAREAASTPAERIDERDRLEFPDARFDPESEPAEPLRPIHDTTLGPQDADSGDDAAPPVAPEFVLNARRKARWNGPLARVGLSLAGLLLSIVLALQAGHQFRDTIAARWPVSQPLLSAWCDAVGCRLMPPRHIDDIAVESTSLTRAEGVDGFKLAVTLRNHGTVALALPSVDLTLTDAAGELVARRMLAPKEWRLKTTTLPAGAELPMQLLLAADGGRVTGYTVEVFYP